MKIKGLGHKQQRSMFPQKSPFYPPFRAILPPFCHPFGFDSARGQPLSGTQGKGVATFALVTMVGPNRVLPDQPRVNLAALRTVKLLPAFLTRLIDKSCAIRMSDGQVSSCQRAYTRAPPFGVGDTRAFFSYRIAKDGRHDPDILSLRQDCPTLAGVSGKWSLVDGMSAIEVGSFCRSRAPSVPLITAFLPGVRCACSSRRSIVTWTPPAARPCVHASCSSCWPGGGRIAGCSRQASSTPCGKRRSATCLPRWSYQSGGSRKPQGRSQSIWGVASGSATSHPDLGSC